MRTSRFLIWNGRVLTKEIRKCKRFIDLISTIIIFTVQLKKMEFPKLHFFPFNLIIHCTYSFFWSTILTLSHEYIWTCLSKAPTQLATERLFTHLNPAPSVISTNGCYSVCCYSNVLSKNIINIRCKIVPLWDFYMDLKITRQCITLSVSKWTLFEIISDW